MDCNLCGDLSSPPAAEGPCHAHTSLYVCTRGRPDNTVHGERCQCHCDNLFCLTHARAHLGDIGFGTMAECFPALSMSLAGPVLMASVDLTLRRADSGGMDFSIQRSDKNGSRRTIALFLSYATPGIVEIEEALLAAPGIAELEVSEDQLWPVARLHVTDTFLTSRRMERIMGVAMRQIADVWRTRPGLVHKAAADARNPSRLPFDTKSQFIDTLCYALAEYDESQDTPFEVHAAHVEAVRILSRHPRASEETVDPLIMRALHHATTAPRSAHEQAEWLVAPDDLGQTDTRSESYALVT
jgi:hypothetical protein